MAASELDELGNTEQERGDLPSAAAAGELDETGSDGTAHDRTVSEDEAGASAAGPAPGSEPGSEPASESGPAPEPLAESPETQSESNPSEAAPLNAESSAE